MGDISQYYCAPPELKLQNGTLNFRTIGDLNHIIRKNSHLICENFDIIVGIPRSGLLCANIISLFLNKPLLTMNDFQYNNIQQISASRGRHERINIKDARILIVDDSITTGSALRRAKFTIDSLISSGKIRECKYLCVYATDETAKLADFYFEVNIPPAKPGAL